MKQLQIEIHASTGPFSMREVLTLKQEPADIAEVFLTFSRWRANGAGGCLLGLALCGHSSGQVMQWRVGPQRFLGGRR